MIDHYATKKNILLICGDVVDANMGGVGVRSWELAGALARRFHVTLAIPNPTSLTPSGFEVVSYQLTGGDLRPSCVGKDVIITHGFVLHFHPYLRELNIPLAIDLYVPFLLESLIWHSGEDFTTQIPDYEEYLRVQTELIRSGDFFFCASERQRDYWTGWLHALKRVNPHTVNADTSLRELIDLVPFGIPLGRPEHARHVLKGVVPGIAVDDRVVIWSGGLWDWLDPLTLIHAFSILKQQDPTIKLYFMGTRHPNPTVSGMGMPEKAIGLAKDLGLYEKNVFFGGWAPYHERGNFLTEADASVLTHQGHIETHFSFRTRILDSLWAELPVIISAGDAMAELVEDNQIGKVVPPNDASAVAAAIREVLDRQSRGDFNQAMAQLKEQYRWANVVAPLEEFCSAPHFAPDKGLYRTELERITHDKDLHFEKVISDWRHEVEVRDGIIRKYQNLLPIRILQRFRKLVKKP